ncbi:hypothetical protein BT93_F0671 [Corymbia citriodora subsp. variegata]|nr:hypothetical protein BT93_F0671 [Corymbia citriodora subsp. variegata]KAF8023235.1 hypothetical protein BT93_F0671 [Corymbia citriodora subsp. variegata]KAF8023236.1 hypothetical protein BT93_F0671 [Corymbia citriodora subsp. variegata]
MCYKTPGEYCELLIEIKSDEQVKGMVQLASKSGSIHLYVEGGVDSEWEGEYDDEMMEMLREEWAMKTDVYSDEDGPEWDISSPDEDSDSVSVGESETDGTSSIDDFQSETGHAECFEVTRNRRQMRGGRIGHSGNVNGGKMTNMEGRKKKKDESGEPADQNDVFRLSCQRCEGVEHHESTCKATTEVEDEGDPSFVKRDRTVETDRIPTKAGRGSGTRRASNLGRDPAERRGIVKSSRNSKGSTSGRVAASTSGKGKGSGRGRGSGSRRSATNVGASSSSGRSLLSSSQSSSTSSTGKGKGATSGKSATASLGRGKTKLGASSRSGTDRGSSSPQSSAMGRATGSISGTDATMSLGRGTAKMGTSLRSGTDNSSLSPRRRAALIRGRGRGSTSGKGATMNLGRGTTLGLGRGTIEMGASSILGTDKGSSYSRSNVTLITGRDRGSISEKRATVSSGRGTTLSLGKGISKMGASLKSGMDKGSNSAKTGPQTSSS